jgi:hypothetical protein
MRTTALLCTLLLTLSTTILAAPAADPETYNVKDGATHFARSVPQILAQKKAAEKRAEKLREKPKEMGIW